MIVSASSKCPARRAATASQTCAEPGAATAPPADPCVTIPAWRSASLRQIEAADARHLRRCRAGCWSAAARGRDDARARCRPARPCRTPGPKAARPRSRRDRNRDRASPNRARGYPRAASISMPSITARKSSLRSAKSRTACARARSSRRRTAGVEGVDSRAPCRKSKPRSARGAVESAISSTAGRTNRSRTSPRAARAAGSASRYRTSCPRRGSARVVPGVSVCGVVHRRWHPADAAGRAAPKYAQQSCGAGRANARDCDFPRCTRLAQGIALRNNRDRRAQACGSRRPPAPAAYRRSAPANGRPRSSSAPVRPPRSCMQRSNSGDARAAASASTRARSPPAHRAECRRGRDRGNPSPQSCRWLMICSAAHSASMAGQVARLSPCTSSTSGRPAWPNSGSSRSTRPSRHSAAW